MGKNRKHRKRDDFLDGFQLRPGEFVGAVAIRRYLKAILKKRYPPTEQDHLSTTARF
jgi:hypothetical protein